MAGPGFDRRRGEGLSTERGRGIIIESVGAGSIS